MVSDQEAWLHLCAHAPHASDVWLAYMQQSAREGYPSTATATQTLGLPCICQCRSAVLITCSHHYTHNPHQTTPSAPDSSPRAPFKNTYLYNSTYIFTTPTDFCALMCDGCGSPETLRCQRVVYGWDPLCIYTLNDIRAHSTGECCAVCGDAHTHTCVTHA